MAYCRNCGAEIDEKAVMCPVCGTLQKNLSPANDSYEIIWMIVGFFIPLAGLILFLVWRESKPKSSKAAGIGALISAGWEIFSHGSILLSPFLFPFIL